MKFFFAIVIAASSLLASTIATAAVPDANLDPPMASFEVSADDMTIGHLEVTDDRFPGVTFTGTAESVYEQMKALNPRAFSDVDSGDVVRARSVRKRSTLNCDWGNDILGEQSCHDGYWHLRSLGRAKCCVRGGIGHCARVSCSYKCGVFLCNKRTTGFCAFCGHISNDMNEISTCPVKVKHFWSPAGALDFDDHFTGINKDSSC